MLVQGKIFDPIKLAIDIFLEIKREINESSEEIGSKLRSKAREIPELIESVGLIPALSFCYAKRRGESEEARPYEIYLRVVLIYLRKLQILDIDVKEALEKPAIVLEKLYPMSGVIVSLLRPFLIEFKRLCEAEWKPE